jgi:hydrogenase nickel incorporation protein HypB
MMCAVFGCGEGETRIEGHEHEQSHRGHAHTHAANDHVHDDGQGPAHAHAPGMSQARMVQIEEDILGKNNEYAGANRYGFSERGILALNLVSSPGSGKTSLLTRTMEDLGSELAMSVDAERARRTGEKALQINTGKGCHLDAHQVGHAPECDVQRCLDHARRVNPSIKVLKVSATSGEGMDAWYQRIRASRQLAAAGQ